MLGHGPKRWSEVVALVSLSTTLFLYLHTRDLATQLSQERTQRHTEAGADLALAEDIHMGEEGETVTKAGRGFLLFLLTSQGAPTSTTKITSCSYNAFRS